MSVTPNQIVAYGCALMPEADGAVTGGAVDFTKRILFSDLPYQGLSGTANTDALDIVSGTLGDTGVKVQVLYRDSTGVVQTSSVATVTGTTIVSSAFGGVKAQRLQACVATGGSIGSLGNPGGTAATSDIAVMSHTRIVAGHTAGGSSGNTSGSNPPLFSLQAGDGATLAALVYQGLGVIIRITGGPGVGQLRYISASYNGTASYGTDIVAINRDWITIPTNASTYDLAYGFLMDILPNPVSALCRLFENSASDVPGGAVRIYYDKCFLVNTNGSTSLLNANVQISSESGVLPSGVTLDLALGSALNDTTTIVNRVTAPANTGGFVVQPSPINVPSSNIPAGNNAAGAVACWLRSTLNPGAASYQGAGNLRTNGTSV